MLRTQETFTSKTPVHVCSYPHTPSSSSLWLFISFCLLHSPSPSSFASALTSDFTSLYPLFMHCIGSVKVNKICSLQISSPAIVPFFFFSLFLSLLFCVWVCGRTRTASVTPQYIHPEGHRSDSAEYCCVSLCETPLTPYGLILWLTNLLPFDLGTHANTVEQRFSFSLRFTPQKWQVPFLPCKIEAPCLVFLFWNMIFQDTFIGFRKTFYI